MKVCFFIATLLLFFAGCTAQQSDQLTPQQIDQIKSEVKAIGDSSLASWERLDGEGITRYYSDSPEWANYDADGSNLDFQTFKKAVLDFGNIASSYNSPQRVLCCLSSSRLSCRFLMDEEVTL